MRKQIHNKRPPLSFDKAQDIGILFDATDLSTRQVVLEYADHLRDAGKRVKRLGFFDSKLDDPNFTFKYFNRKKLDWTSRPTGENVKEFTQQSFDWLLILSSYTKSYFEYIAAASNASLRVGPVTENTFCYDIMIDTGSADLKQFIEQMELVLAKTNTRHETAEI
ncbi:MAG: hypothetical protein SFU99_02485 [Saprospiraceae bacterium]|nr:hypothetical protein [Saprospiraceae bacterium]